MRQSKAVFWIFLFPCLFAFTFTVLVPAVMGLYYSFTDWNGIGGDAAFVGASNYLRIFKDGNEFGKAFFYTLGFTVLCVAAVNLLAFGLGLLVTQKIRGRTALRSIFFMPNLIGGILVGFVWQFIFTQVFNSMGKSLHLPFLENWLSTAGTATLALAIVVVWQMAGYMMLIYIAQLQNIPDSLIESAKIDGATPLQRLRYITLPLMAPAFTVGLFLTMSNCFKLYDQNLTLTNGGPSNSTEMAAMNIFKTAFTQNELGLAQAKAVLFLIVAAGITLTQLYFSKRREVEL